MLIFDADKPMTDLSGSEYETLFAHLAEQVATCIDGTFRSEADKAAVDALSNTWAHTLTVREWLVATGRRLGVDTSRCI